MRNNLRIKKSNLVILVFTPKEKCIIILCFVSKIALASL